LIVKNIVSFIAKQEGDEKKARAAIGSFKNPADVYFKPFIAAMQLEQSYRMKPACVQDEVVNPITPKKCLRGSHWTPIAQNILAGDIDFERIRLETFDNFHPVAGTPIKLSALTETCEDHGRANCTIKGYTVSENVYNNYSDLGHEINAATEIKAKLMSRQLIRISMGHTDADFKVEDGSHTMCKEINQFALDWALKNADEHSLDKYNRLGKKLVMGDDYASAIMGPQWVYSSLSFQDSKDKKTTVVRAPNLLTSHAFPLKSLADAHYCKLLSPYRALEWIYVDSL
jgi:hypothetical protein